MKFALRNYSPQTDFDDVFRFTKEILGLVPSEESKNELKSYPDKTLCSKVAIDDKNNIIGFIAATYPYWNYVAIIDYLIIQEKCRNQGIGSDLVKSVEKEMQNACVRIITVQTATWNEDGIRFYNNLGYNKCGVFPAYFGINNDLIWLNKYLA